MFLLRVSPAESEPFEHRIEGDAVFVGRSTKCDVTIADRFLSRRHARLFACEDGWCIEDLGSRNGTFVNGRPVEESAAIGPGDVITLSASQIQVHRAPGRRVETDAITDVPSSDRLLKSAAEVLRRTETPPPDDDADRDAALLRYAGRLAVLNEVHQAMAGSVSLDDLLELIMDNIFVQLTPERAEIFMRSDSGGYACVANRSAPRSTLRTLYSESLFSEVVDKSMAALVTDARTDDRFAEAESLVSAGVRSLLAAPLIAPDGALGLIVVGSDASVRDYSEEDLELLVTLASVTAMRIHTLTLAQDAAEHQRMERELTIARRLQIALISERLPTVEGYRLYGSTVPSRGVSGDYFQLFERDDGAEVVMALADVSGKGIAAALVTAYLEAVSSGPIEDGMPPHEVFTRVSRKLHGRTPPNRFATMFLGVLSPRDATFAFASAGHAPACLVRSSGAVEWLSSTGVPLGLVADPAYSTDEAAIDPGDTLVVYSDGYTEAEGPDGEEFGQDRFAEVVVDNQGLEPDELAAAIDTALEGYVAGQPYVDDRTLVIVRRND